jgi:cytochrome c-type biogenesis protein CcmH
VTLVRRVLPVALLAGVVAAGLALGARPDHAGTSVPARVERITAQLRCPVCQGLSVADSPSSTAKTITADVRRRVEAGESDDEVKAAYVERYGDWILLRPRSGGIATLVWALPAAVLALAAGALAMTFRRWRREPAQYATEADRDLVDAARRDRTPPEGDLP